MKKPVVYSGSNRGDAQRRQPGPQAAAGAAEPARATAPAATVTTLAGLRERIRPHERALMIGGIVLLVGALMFVRDPGRAPARQITQDDINAAVLHTLETKTLPSRAARAAETVQAAVVRIKGYEDERYDEPGAEDKPEGVGSGVVIVDNGIILTNLHVVAGAKRVIVTFYDGSESEVEMLRAYPENDLAVVRARTIPDDLEPATLGSTADLQPGDEVVAVGFPFGIGPSVSAGVVSGLNREFRSPEGKRVLTGLIQFDAAANPGNSGGPLVTMNGEVVGIVTAILNPTPARTFIGIGFATTIESAGAAVGIPPF
jgi:S1-C subfamily serine protease